MTYGRMNENPGSHGMASHSRDWHQRTDYTRSNIYLELYLLIIQACTASCKNLSGRISSLEQAEDGDRGNQAQGEVAEAMFTGEAESLRADQQAQGVKRHQQQRQADDEAGEQAVP